MADHSSVSLLVMEKEARAASELVEPYRLAEQLASRRLRGGFVRYGEKRSA